MVNHGSPLITMVKTMVVEPWLTVVNHGFVHIIWQGNDLLNSENLKEAIAQLCHDIEVCNFTML